MKHYSFMEMKSVVCMYRSLSDKSLTCNRRLNQIAPLEDLRHVKRIQKKNLEGGMLLIRYSV